MDCDTRGIGIKFMPIYMRMHNTRCPLCGSFKNYTVLYPARFEVSSISAGVFSARRVPDRLHYQLVRCRRDGMVRSNPILSAVQLQKLYTKSRFTYHEELHNLTVTYMAALEPILRDSKPTDSFLEIGCGNGFMLTKLIQKGYHNVHGVEPSIDAVKYATGEVRKKITIGMLRKTLYRPSSLHVILLFQTLDHIDDPNKLLRTCYNMLAPGGYILSFNHNIEALSARLLGEASPIIDIEHTALYSKRTVRSLFYNSGYIPLRVSTPWNYVSFRHLVRLVPLPRTVKEMLAPVIPPMNLWLPLGNLCIIAQKPL